jgi:hypothetical protein
LFFGSGLSIIGLFLQRNWAESVYPWLQSNGWDVALGSMLQTVSQPLNPYIVWTMNPVKFPINSFELYFMSMLVGIAAYIIGSLLTQRQPFNLDRMLHRGEYDIAGEYKEPLRWSLGNVFQKLIGITTEYTLGDKVIAWSVVGYAIIYKFGICFVLVLVWNAISPWPVEWWSTYFFITSLVVTGIIGIISTFWFLIGGIIDMRRLFKDLALRVDNPLDDGRVEGHVSVADKAMFEERTHEKQDD